MSGEELNYSYFREFKPNIRKIDGFLSWDDESKRGKTFQKGCSFDFQDNAGRILRMYNFSN